MIPGLTLTIGSIFFMILLLIVYFSQNNKNTIETKLYKYMLITMMFLLITEVISSVITYYSTDYTIKSYATRAHWSTAIFWFYFLYFYSITFVFWDIASLLTLTKSPVQRLAIVALSRRREHCMDMVSFTSLPAQMWLVPCWTARL